MGRKGTTERAYTSPARRQTAATTKSSKHKNPPLRKVTPRAAPQSAKPYGDPATRNA